MKRLVRSIYASLPLKRQLFGLVRGRLSLPRSVYQHLHFKGPFTVEVDDHHRFRMESYGEVLENDVFWGGFGGSWEEVSLKAWVRLCRSADCTILDIGANTGIYSLAAAAVAPDAEIIAFEPIARIAERLALNIELNHFPIRIIQKAASDRTGTLDIYDIADATNYSASLEQPLQNTTSYPVEVTTIDEFLSGAPNVRRPLHAVKIDVETHEPAVIRGMERTLVRDRPAILIEILDGRIGDEVSSMISGSDYRMFHIHEERGLIETDRLMPIGGRNWNHLICPEDKFVAAGLNELIASSSMQ